MENIYIVWGQTGKYSDRQEWFVRAFALEEEAVDLVKRLSAWCDEHQVGENNKVIAGYDIRHSLKNTEDPGFICDYTGTCYGVSQVPFGLSDKKTINLTEAAKIIYDWVIEDK